jgi:hypothetical protein
MVKLSSGLFVPVLLLGDSGGFRIVTTAFQSLSAWRIKHEVKWLFFFATLKVSKANQMVIELLVLCV